MVIIIIIVYNNNYYYIDIISKKCRPNCAALQKSIATWSSLKIHFKSQIVSQKSQLDPPSHLKKNP